mgnify:CR=1 FL=1|jgi:hypothetical protein
MVPIDYQVVGEEEYALKIHIGSDGRYRVESGTYTTQPPRDGQLSGEQEQQLLDAIKILGIPREHPVPTGSAAFEARLTVGEPGAEAVYAFWEGALEEDAELNSLVRLLERL